MNAGEFNFDFSFRVMFHMGIKACTNQQFVFNNDGDDYDAVYFGGVSQKNSCPERFHSFSLHRE